jgi:hypothetical protein
VPQSDHPACQIRPHGPKRRSDSTRPPGTRRPWPTAPTTTRVSPAKPGSTRARAGSRGSAAESSQPTPATVWTAGRAPIDPDTAWPTPIVKKIVEAFSKPSGHVALLPWPTQQSDTLTKPARHDWRSVIGANGDVRHPPEAESHTEVATALAAVESLDRTARVVRVSADLAGPVSRPAWAERIGDAGGAPAITSAPSPGLEGTVPDGTDTVSADTDLIITSLRPEHGGGHVSDVVALAAARLLRVGGILAVLTKCDWTSGELIDPTGAVVAAAQNADLLFFQHIVAVHVPVRDGRFATEMLTDADGSAVDAGSCAAPRAAVRGLPAPHRRIHSDVLVFAQPREFEPLATNPSGHVPATGAL